jgi:hypothetical protein
MRRLEALSMLVFVLLAACAEGMTNFGAGGSGRGGGTPIGNGGSGGSGGSGGMGGGAVLTTSSHSSSSTSGSGPTPTNCSQADGYQGCCVGNVSYYCPNGSSTVTKKICPSGQVCGWNPGKSYYACVAPPAQADPTNTYPIACK